MDTADIRDGNIQEHQENSCGSQSGRTFPWNVDSGKEAAKAKSAKNSHDKR
jgi:hypothetical protein